jgi:FMN phosphatase YigB (HAD superfamily)
VADGILLVDLDGTLYTGDGPVLWYADEVARLTGTTRIPAALRRFLAGDRSNPALAGTEDGWGAVQALAAGVAPSIVDMAFRGSRRALADGTIPVTVPAGFVELLGELRDRYLVVLATNSPRDGLLELLARLGVANLFHEVVFSARKPDGLRPLLLRLLGAIGATAEPWRAFSVGDHWRNDIAPARELGAATGYVDRLGRAAGPADLTAPSVPELLDGIRCWAADPGAFHSAVSARAHAPGSGTAAGRDARSA